MDELNIGGVDYVSGKVVGRMTGHHPGTIRNWRSDGREPIPSHRFGNRVFYRRLDVEAYLSRRSVTM